MESEPRWAVDWRIAGVHLVVLWSFAVAQPVLDIVPQNAEFFIGREVGGLSLVAFVALFVFVPPLVLLAAALVVGRLGRAARRRAQVAAVALLMILGALYVLGDRLPDQGWPLVPVAIVLGAAAAVAYARWRFVPTLLSALAPAPVLFLVLFLFFSPAQKVIAAGVPELAGAPTRSDTPVVVVVVDELPVSSLMDPTERIDAERYPAFGRLAEDATWFRNTTAAADFTVRAVPALLTGQRVHGKPVPLAADHPRNLFTLLGKSHELHVSEYATELCPGSLCTPSRSEPRRALELPSAFSAAALKMLIPRAIDSFTPPLGLTWAEYARAKDPSAEVDAEAASHAELAKRADVQAERFMRDLRGLRPGGARPPLVFFHSVLPHTAWKFLPSGQIYTGEYGSRTAAFEGDNWTRQPEIVRHLQQRHLLQTQYADAVLGAAVRELRRKGLYDKSLIVVVGDHGGSFRPGAHRREIQRSNAADVGSVPLLVKVPGQKAGAIDDRHLQTIDVLPTIADVIGVRIPWRMDGRSAFRLPASGRKRLVIAGDDPGRRVTVAPATLERQRRATVARQTAIFGSGDDGPGLFGLGHHPELEGTRVARWPRAGVRGQGVVIDTPEDYRAVDPSSQFLPALVTGALTGDSARLPELAVAVNGRIVATPKAYRANDGRRFATMLPPGSLRAGHNRVRVLAVMDSEHGVGLAPLGGTP